MNLRSLFFVLLFAVSSSACAGSFHAGLRVSEDVNAEETGLPGYPGATIVENRHGDNDSAKVQIGFGEYGLKVVVAKLRSDDSMEKIAAFYREQLAQYGAVLDCSGPQTDKPRERKSKALTCEGDRPEKRGLLFKAGRKSDQYLVAIKPKGSGSEFSLVHVQVNGIDW